MSKPSSKDLRWMRKGYTLTEILRKFSLPIILQNSDYKHAVLWVDQIFTTGALCARGKKDQFLLIPYNSPLIQKLQIYKDSRLKSVEDALHKKWFPFRVTSNGQVTYLMEDGIETRLFDKLTIESQTNVDYLLACKLTLESDTTKPQLVALPISSRSIFHIATGYKKTQFDWENFKSLVKSRIDELMVFHPKTISKVVFNFDSNPLKSYTAMFPRCISFDIKEIAEEHESHVDKPTQPVHPASEPSVANLAIAPVKTQQSPNTSQESPDNKVTQNEGQALAAPVKEDIVGQQEDTSVHKEDKKRKHKKDGHHKKDRREVPQEREQKVHEHQEKRKQRISELTDKEQVATEPVLSFSEQINQKALQIGQLNHQEISQDSHPSTSGINVSKSKAEVAHKDVSTQHSSGDGVSGMAAKVGNKFIDEKMQMSKPESSRLEERKVLESPVDMATPTITPTSVVAPTPMPTKFVSYPSGNTPKLVDKNPTATPTPAVKVRPVTTPTAVTPTQAAKPAPKVATKPPAVRKKLVPKPPQSMKRQSEPSISNTIELPTRPISEIISTLTACGGGIMGKDPSQPKPCRMSLGYDQSNSSPWEAFNMSSLADAISSKQGKNEHKPPDVKQKPQNLKPPPNEPTGKCNIPTPLGKDAGKSVIIVSPTIANIIGKLSVDGEPKIPMVAGSGFSNPSGGKVKIPGKNQNPNEHIYDEIREPIFDAKKSTVTDPKRVYDTILDDDTEIKKYVAIVKNKDNDTPSIPRDPYSGAYVNVQSYK